MAISEEGREKNVPKVPKSVVERLWQSHASCTEKVLD